MAEDRPDDSGDVKTTEHLVGRIAATDLSALAPFRAFPGWQLCPDGDAAFWLRLPAGDAASFRRLPLQGRWSESGDGKIMREGRQVPEAILPASGWAALERWLPVGPPQRGAAGMQPAPIAFQLETGGSDLASTALLCRTSDLVTWADTALAPRLHPLRFAASDDGRALVIGEPMPSIPGTPLYACGRLFLPCGYRLPAHLWPELLEEMLGLGGERHAVIHRDGSCEVIGDESLIPFTRGSIRLTAKSAMPR